MKVTVTFGDTAVVVPCKAGWTVRDLVEQATRRYRRIVEQVTITIWQTSAVISLISPCYVSVWTQTVDAFH